MKHLLEIPMKIIIFIVVILAVVLIYNQLKLKNHDTKLKTEKQSLKDNRYEELRNQSFKTTAQQLELAVNDSEVFGVVMDWNLGTGIMTLVSYKTGDASIYLSSGGGVIGGGQHENVNRAAKMLVNLANKYIGKMSKIDSMPLPNENCIRFYFLTKNGIFSAQEKMSNFEEGSSIWAEYFNQANELISYLRQIYK